MRKHEGEEGGIARLKLWRHLARKASLHVSFGSDTDDLNGAIWRQPLPRPSSPGINPPDQVLWLRQTGGEWRHGDS